MKKLWKKIRYRIEWVFVMSLGWVLQRLSEKTAARMGRLMGALVWYLGVSRKTTIKNLENAFPEKEPGELKKIALSAYRQFGETMISLVRMPVNSIEKVKNQFEFVGLEGPGGMDTVGGFQAPWRLFPRGPHCQHSGII